jgi:glycosyltransferase involved in cell wall biosynthesis
MNTSTVLERPSAASETIRPLSLVTVSTLFPNPVRKTHGVFVETRLRKLIASGEVKARVIAPVPWLPQGLRYGSLGPLWEVPPRLVRDGLEVEHPRYLVIPKVGTNLAPFTLLRAMRTSLSRILESGYRVDLIDAHYFYPDGVAAVWLAREFGLPVVVTARGTDLNLIPEFRLPRRMIQSAATGADGVIAVCAALKERLVALGVSDERVTVLRNGVDLERFRPMEREVIRRDLELTRTTLGSVGHLVERKGHHLAIRALKDLPATDLLVVGDGPQRGALEALARELAVGDRVRFLCAVDQDRLCRLYNAMDALVLASSREGWANVLLESMACGTPVIASAVWGTPEVVASPDAGVLMPSLDADGVVRGVKRLLTDPPGRERTRRYAEGFDWDATTAGQLALFRSVLAHQNHPNRSA